MPQRLLDWFRCNPVGAGPVIGALWGGLLFLCAAAVIVILFLLDMPLHKYGLMDNGTGLSLLSGFLIAPVILIAGLPWTYSALSIQSIGAEVGVAALGLVANGTIVGLIVGLVAKIKNRMQG
jgi:hypothetical protein